MWQYRRSDPSGSSRTTRAILQCVFRSTKPYTTWQPASSSLRAQMMLARSSKRALSSTTTTTCLPASAASISASTIGEVSLVRYRVCLMASTPGSAAAAAEGGAGAGGRGGRGGGGGAGCGRPAVRGLRGQRYGGQYWSPKITD